MNASQPPSPTSSGAESETSQTSDVHSPSHERVDPPIVDGHSSVPPVDAPDDGKLALAPVKDTSYDIPPTTDSTQSKHLETSSGTKLETPASKVSKSTNKRKSGAVKKGKSIEEMLADVDRKLEDRINNLLNTLKPREVVGEAQGVKSTLKKPAKKRAKLEPVLEQEDEEEEPEEVYKGPPSKEWPYDWPPPPNTKAARTKPLRPEATLTLPHKPRLYNQIFG